jgi:hypothetical protein
LDLKAAANSVEVLFGRAQRIANKSGKMIEHKKSDASDFQQ